MSVVQSQMNQQQVTLRHSLMRSVLRTFHRHFVIRLVLVEKWKLEKKLNLELKLRRVGHFCIKVAMNLDFSGIPEMEKLFLEIIFRSICSLKAVESCLGELKIFIKFYEIF